MLYQDEEVFFDNTALFKDVSWTIAYKPTEGVWNSYFSFYPDYSVSHQEFFQVGYNFGEDKETMWNHLMNNRSFCVFQGKYHPFFIELPVPNENVNKILTSVDINIEARRFKNQWDYSINKDVGITDMFIYNGTKNSGNLSLNTQKTLVDQRKYPYIDGNKQQVLTTFNDGKQYVNQFFNRVLNQDNNISMFLRDENNIFKTIDTRAVGFRGKKILERLTGESFILHLSNTKDSRYNILIKNIINDEIIY